MNATIRIATGDDIDGLVELAAATFRETYSSTDDATEIEEYIGREFTPQTLTTILNDPASIVLVALGDRRLLGYAHLKESPPPPCVTGATPIELARLYLRSETIGQGHGAALMKSVLSMARLRNRKTLWLVVYSRNEHARTFYRRFGFVDVGIKDFYFGGRSYPDPVMAMAVRQESGENTEVES